MKQFAEWLGSTGPSAYIQENYSWFIPAVQSIHIIAIAMIVGSVLMLNLRVLGLAGMDQTLRQTTDRFGPWLKTALLVLAVSGGALIVGEPVRELVTFSFWAKMILVVLGAAIAAYLHVQMRRAESAGGSSSVRALAILALIVWICVIVLGRLIAYDHVWGDWSPAEKA